MKIEEDVSSVMNNNVAESVDKVCRILSSIEESIIEYISDLVASLCGISKEEMLADSKKAQGVQVRWFLWYCIRYLTNESYEKIASRMEGMDATVTGAGIGIGITKMSFLIENEPIWNKRWCIMKKIMKTYNEKNPTNEPKSNVVRVVIHKPNDVDVKVEFKNDK